MFSNYMSEYFESRNGVLYIDGVSSLELAAQYGTPLYVMSERQIRKTCGEYRDAINKYYGGNGLALYASKSFSCLGIYNIISEEGMGADVASGGELFTAFKAGFPMNKVYFHGNNKTDDELRMAIEYKVGHVVVDNKEELLRLDKLAGKYNTQMNISFRIKPGIDAHTHDFIRTGQIDSKFGVALENGEAFEIMETASKLNNINVTGVHCHIGSQIFDVDPFVLAAKVMIKFMSDIRDRFGIEIKELNLGGGFGIKYQEHNDPKSYDEYMKIVSEGIKEECGERNFPLPFILVEPGRSISGPSGITLYKIGALKEIKNIRTYISVDGGMTDNPRYALYKAPYDMGIASRIDDDRNTAVTVAGKCCESGDLLQENIKLQNPQAGDILAVFGTGAYNYSMASNYNRIPRPCVVMVNNGKSRVIVKRESYEDLISNDVI